jgi:hypothetical protein
VNEGGRAGGSSVESSLRALAKQSSGEGVSYWIASPQGGSQWRPRRMPRQPDMPQFGSNRPQLAAQGIAAELRSAATRSEAIGAESPVAAARRCAKKTKRQTRLQSKHCYQSRMPDALTISKAWRETRWRARNDDSTDDSPVHTCQSLLYSYLS